jgi:hypothetical protein
MLIESIFHQFKFTNIVNELHDHLMQDMAIISISGNRRTHITWEKLIKYQFSSKSPSRWYMMHKCNGNSFSNTFEDFYYIACFFPLSVVYIINSKLIFSDQKNVIKIRSKPLMYFTSSFDNNAPALLSLFQDKTIW